MPSYDYKCSHCSIDVTVERSIHEDSVAPACCGEPMTRIFTAPPVQFNATGFYSSDNKMP